MSYSECEIYPPYTAAERIEVEWMTDPRRDWPSKQEAEADAVPSTEAADDDDPWAGDPDRPPQCPICLGRHEGKCL
mgnify:CR=1 FL=1